MGTARFYPVGTLDPHLSNPFSSRVMLYLAAGVAFVFALGVFLFLCERDHSFLLQAGESEHQPYVIPAAPALASSPVTPIRTAQPVSTRPTTIPEENDNSIARNHAELVSLEKRGLRHYVEFSLGKSRRLEPVGPVSVGIWRTDARHKTYDLAISAGGHRLQRKHIALYSAVLIATAEHSRPVQFVVNEIDRDGVSGYLSEPRR